MLSIALAALAASSPALASLEPMDGLRCAVVAVGDVDGDGTPDFALAHRNRPFGMGGAPNEAWPEVDRQPVVWVLSGAGGGVLREFHGEPGFGQALVAVGDLDGDGVTDLAVSTGGRGVKDAARTVALLSVGKGVQLATLRPAKGVKAFGLALAGGVQLTGDATPDLLIGGQNAAWVVDGKTWQPVEALRAAKGGELLRVPAESFRLPSLPLAERPVLADGKVDPFGPGLHFPENLAVLADLDGDGRGELALSGPREEDDGALVRSAQGELWSVTTRVHFSAGKAPALALDTAAWCLASGRDLDGDGIGDLVTTTVDDHTRAWSVGKRALLWEQTYRGGYMHAEGTSLAFTGDHDGDGVADVLVAANETGMDADTGFVAIHSGATGKALKDWRVTTDADPKPPSSYVGGLDATPIGDLDGDGLEEIAVQLPVLQEVRVLNGKDLSVRWRLDVAELPRGE